MKKLFLFICVILIASCNSKKEENSTIQNEEINKKVQKKEKEKKEIKTLTEFLAMTNKISAKNY